MDCASDSAYDLLITDIRTQELKPLTKNGFFVMVLLSSTTQKKQVICMPDFRFVYGYTVFHDGGFQYGVARTIGHDLHPYCAWIDDEGKLKKVEGDWENNSNDWLLRKLAKENPDAARWLLNKRPVLENPKSTIVALGICGVLQIGVVNTSIIQIPNRVMPNYDDLMKLVMHYGWAHSFVDGNSMSNLEFKPAAQPIIVTEDDE